MYKDAIETQDAYAINQYNACCRYLDIPVSFDAEGETLLEKIVLLTEQRDRLADALERIKNYQGRFAEEDPESIASESLQSLDQN
jgi:hypothetical protein